jgi:aminoglycoside phosphotransferase (APT) family kinase protein
MNEQTSAAVRPASTDLRAEARSVLSNACRRVGLDASDAELLRLRSNAVFLLPRAAVVVRIATSPSAPQRLPAVLAATRWLSERGFPTVVPVDLPQPLQEGGRTVTFWRYVPGGRERASTRDLARLLRALHDEPMPALGLPALTDPLAGLRRTLDDSRGVLADDERAWLTARVADLTLAWEQLGLADRPVLLHGDTWIDNVLHAADDRVLLLDWDHVCVGPREWDLLPTYHGRRRFGLTDQDVDEFADAYGSDLRHSPGYPTLMTIRDFYAIGIHIRNAAGDAFSRRELKVRLDSLLTEDVSVQWRLKDEAGEDST